MPQKYSMSMYNVHSVKLEAEIRKICSSKEPNKKTKIIFFFFNFLNGIGYATNHPWYSNYSLRIVYIFDSCVLLSLD